MIVSRSVTICERDAARIAAVIARSHCPENHMLHDEIDAATVVPDAALPPDVVSMGAKVTFRDQTSSEEVTVRLVFPDELETENQAVSILAPVGAALIGLRVGEEIEWPMPNGRSRTLFVVSVEPGEPDR